MTITEDNRIAKVVGAERVKDLITLSRGATVYGIPMDELSHEELYLLLPLLSMQQQAELKDARSSAQFRDDLRAARPLSA